MHSGCKIIVFCSNLWICHNCYIGLFKMDLSRLINGFLWVATWICQSCYMDLSKLLHAFVKVCTYISHPMANKTMLEFEEDFQDWQTFCYWDGGKIQSELPSLFCKSSEITVFMQISLWLFEDENNHWKNLLSF